MTIPSLSVRTATPVVRTIEPPLRICTDASKSPPLLSRTQTDRHTLAARESETRSAPSSVTGGPACGHELLALVSYRGTLHRPLRWLTASARSAAHQEALKEGSDRLQFSTAPTNARQPAVLHRFFTVAHERTTALLTQMRVCASGKNFGFRLAHGD